MTLFLYMVLLDIRSIFFFFNDTATTEIYTLSLHDALPILRQTAGGDAGKAAKGKAKGKKALLDQVGGQAAVKKIQDRKSTRLNSSHLVISYAVFCLKKKKIYNAIGYTGMNTCCM